MKKVKIKIIDPFSLLKTDFPNKVERKKNEQILKSKNIKIVAMNEKADKTIFIALNCQSFVNMIKDKLELELDQLYFVPDTRKNFYLKNFEFKPDQIIENFDFHNWQMSLASSFTQIEL